MTDLNTTYFSSSVLKNVDVYLDLRPRIPPFDQIFYPNLFQRTENTIIFLNSQFIADFVTQTGPDKISI